MAKPNKEQIKKKAVAQASKRQTPKDYFRGIRLEMGKVIWPTKKELGSFTAVVLATCAFFALGFWLIDTGVLVALRAVLDISLF